LECDNDFEGISSGQSPNSNSDLAQVPSQAQSQFQLDSKDLNFVYLKAGLLDVSSQNLYGFLLRGINFIESARQKGTKVLVHCVMGISRSPSMVIAYCMYYRGWKLQDAYRYVRSRRSEADITTFRSQLVKFEGFLRSQRWYDEDSPYKNAQGEFIPPSVSNLEKNFLEFKSSSDICTIL